MRSPMLAVVVLLGAPGAAGAAVTPGEYGGGAVAGPPAPDARTAWFTADVDGTSAVIGGRVGSRCGIVFGSARVRLAADGSFSVRTRYRVRGRPRQMHRLVLAGRFDGAVASGTVTATLKTRGRTCRVRDLHWQLRHRAQPGPPAPPQAGATYYGLTGQHFRRTPHPFLLMVSPDGTQVLTTVMGYVKYCRHPFPKANFSPTVPIAPDGTFAIRERFTERFTDAVERSRLRIDGRFTAGGVTGTFRVRSVARRRGSGRVFDRCDTGTRRFTAVV